MGEGRAQPCALCGQEATGRAFIADLRYCHGDDDAQPTCYEQGTWDISHGSLEGTITPFGP